MQSLRPSSTSYGGAFTAALSQLVFSAISHTDGNADVMEWLPSSIFQDLYAKLNRVASIASDMFVGRERFATLLLMRLETVILWLSENQSFWDDTEEGPRPLGPFGLQQFVACFASQGRYLSWNLHRVVNDIISKAMAAFSATGMDPQSVLRKMTGLLMFAKMHAMERLGGKPKVSNGDLDLCSPMASMSVQSISSNRSHGSS